MGLAEALERVPAVREALHAGRIDLARARVFADELAGLEDLAAAAVAAGCVDMAGSWTTGQLRAKLRSLVLSVDPQALRKRAEAGQRLARVESWQEGSGNHALAGRELPAAEVIAADARITEIARALKAAGATGDMDLLRAAVYTALLTGRDPSTLIPAAPGSRGPAGDGPAGSDPAGSDPAGGGSVGGGPAAEGPAALGGSNGVGSAGVATGTDGMAAQAGSRGASSAGVAEGSGASPSPGGSTLTGLTRLPGLTGLTGLTGSVHLTLPVSVWLGMSDVAGEVSGHGPVDASTCRDLADRLAAGPGARWCVTLTGPDGRAVAHACARRGPPSCRAPGNGLLGGGSPGAGSPGAGLAGWLGSPGGGSPGAGSPGAGLAGWLGSLSLAWLESGECSHGRRSEGYRPPERLRHLVKVRQRTCAFPGCRRPARQCDDDHTVAYDVGGLTCECNLSPLCRRHHQVKQTAGWQLAQVTPGVLTWTAPHGRDYTTSPGTYPI